MVLKARSITGLLPARAQGGYSHYITTFSIHVSLFRCERLNNGTNAPAKIFQFTLQQQLQGFLA